MAGVSAGFPAKKVMISNYPQKMAHRYHVGTFLTDMRVLGSGVLVARRDWEKPFGSCWDLLFAKRAVLSLVVGWHVGRQVRCPPPRASGLHGVLANPIFP